MHKELCIVVTSLTRLPHLQVQNALPLFFFVILSLLGYRLWLIFIFSNVQIHFSIRRESDKYSTTQNTISILCKLVSAGSSLSLNHGRIQGSCPSPRWSNHCKLLLVSFNYWKASPIFV